MPNIELLAEHVLYFDFYFKIHCERNTAEWKYYICIFYVFKKGITWHYLYIQLIYYVAGGSKSNSSHSSCENFEKSSAIPTINILSPNNCRSGSDTDSLSKIISSGNNKRESETLEKEKASKIAKLSDNGQRYEKENVDPRKFMPPVSFYILLMIACIISLYIQSDWKWLTVIW